MIDFLFFLKHGTILYGFVYKTDLAPRDQGSKTVISVSHALAVSVAICLRVKKYFSKRLRIFKNIFKGPMNLYHKNKDFQQDFFQRIFLKIFFYR